MARRNTARSVVLFLMVAITAGFGLTQREAATTALDGAMVTLRAYDIETGEPVTGACFSLEHEQNGACDGDHDGTMTFANRIPPGIYDVGYERTADGDHLSVWNFPLVVVGTDDLNIPIAFMQARDSMPNRAEVTVISTSTEATPASSMQCVTIHGASVNEIQGDVALCGSQAMTGVARTGTAVLTYSCQGMEASMWIAITDDTEVVLPNGPDACSPSNIPQVATPIGTRRTAAHSIGDSE